jgi:hypothetical protein
VGHGITNKMFTAKNRKDPTMEIAIKVVYTEKME